MKISARQITSEKDRQLAIAVLKETYKEEKRWIEEDDRLFDPAELDNDDVAWFVAMHDDKPVGVVRVMFKLPLEIYEKYGFRQIGPGWADRKLPAWREEEVRPTPSPPRTTSPCRGRHCTPGRSGTPRRARCPRSYG